MSDQPNLVGCTKADLATPALCLDLDRLDSNVQHLVDECVRRGVQWRPHAKCHKSPIIGKWLVEAGACGLTCATLREAEVMADAGIDDLLIANLIAGAPKIRRLVQLAEKSDVMICIDHVDQAIPISRALAEAKRSVRVLVELEIGMRRVGVEDSEDVKRLSEQIVDLPGLEFVGLMAYEGHLLTIKDLVEKERAIQSVFQRVASIRTQLEQAGLSCPIVSGGGTGSYPITLRQPGITELQSGGAIFMDAFYRDPCQIQQLQNSLTILATVNSVPTKQRAVIDAGRKAMNIEICTPQVVGRDGVQVESLSAEHGVLAVSAAADPLAIGERIELIPGYADLTNMLHSCFYGFRQGRLELEIPIVR
ncbi:MAG: DSD1 family PLP-dependent enzyme [Planctomycetaceae bacterium]|nr:DSD1 family PLP-dependent enzyme [Planctomycetaceae bacterium]